MNERRGLSVAFLDRGHLVSIVNHQGGGSLFSHFPSPTFYFKYFLKELQSVIEPFLSLRARYSREVSYPLSPIRNDVWHGCEAPHTSTLSWSYSLLLTVQVDNLGNVFLETLYTQNKKGSR